MSGPVKLWPRITVLLLLSTGMLGAGLGLRCPWGPGESALAVAGGEMLAGGAWLQPTIGGVSASLPLLPVWLQALAQKLTGSTCAGFLLPALLAALGTLLLTWGLSRRLAGRDAAPGAWLLLLATPQFALAARDGGTAMVVTFLMTLSLYGLLRHLLVRPDWRWLAAGSATAGTSALAGGPVWLAILALLPWGLARSRGWRLPPVPSHHWWLGAAAFLAVSAASSALVSVRGVGSTGAATSLLPDLWPASPWTLLLWWLPVTALLPWLVPGWRDALGQRDPRVLVVGGWLLLAGGPLGLWGGGDPAAMLPALPALAVLASPWLAGLCRRRGIRRLALGLALLVPTGLVAYSLWPPEPAQAALDAGEPFGWPFVRWSVLLGLGAVLVFRQPRAVAALVIVFCGTATLLAVLGRPALDPYRSGREIMDLAALIAPDNEPLGLMESDPRWFVAARRPLAHFGDAADRRDQQARALAWLAGDPDRRLVAAGGDGACFDEGTAILLGAVRGRPRYLVAAADAGTDCRPHPPSANARPVLWNPSTARIQHPIP